MNLLSLFKYFNLERGENQVINMVCGDTPIFREWIKTWPEYKEASDSFQIFYSKIRPVRYGHHSKYNHIEVKHEGKINVGVYYIKFQEAHQEKIKEEVSKIEKLLLSSES
jgi:hypothetical protein